MIMNIRSLLTILAGGAGSGPNAPCPQCGPHNFKEGDRVKVKSGIPVTNPKSGAKTLWKEGSIATINNVLPKVPGQDQMVGIESEKDQKQGKFGNMGYVKVQDITLHSPRSEHDLPVWTKSWSRNPIAPVHKRMDIQPVPEKQVIMRTKTADGARLTWVKPADEKEETIRSLKQIASEDHSMKGDFALIDKVKGIQDRVGTSRNTRIYDTSGMPAPYQTGRGTTLQVSSYLQKGRIRSITVEEQNYTTHAQRLSTMTFEYKNAAAAVGMLSSRYGIKTTLARLRS